MNKSKFIFKINNTSIKLFIGIKVFKPTATTTFLLRDAAKLVNKSKDILDLGCGSGVIGVCVNKLNKNKNKNKIFFFINTSKKLFKNLIPYRTEISQFVHCHLHLAVMQ